MTAQFQCRVPKSTQKMTANTETIQSTTRTIQGVFLAIQIIQGAIQRKKLLRRHFESLHVRIKPPKS